MSAMWKTIKSDEEADALTKELQSLLVYANTSYNHTEIRKSLVVGRDIARALSDYEKRTGYHKKMDDIAPVDYACQRW